MQGLLDQYNFQLFGLCMIELLRILVFFQIECNDWNAACSWSAMKNGTLSFEKTHAFCEEIPGFFSEF